METLHIKKDDAVKAHENATTKGRKMLEDLFGKKTFLRKPTERIKTVADVLEDNNITQDELDKFFAYVPEHLKFQYIAELLAKSLNEGWAPDWDDSSQYKYFPWFKMGSSGFRFGGYDFWITSSDVGSRLCFKSSELAIYAGEQFTDLYRKFMITE